MFNFFTSTSKKIEKAKAKLIEDLKNGSIDFLLQQMASDKIYSPLLNINRTTVVDNTDDISWYAYRRAEELTTPADKEQLLKKLNFESDPSLKRHIYFCLSHLCKNTNDVVLFNFLMNTLEMEKDKDCKRIILLGLPDIKKNDSFNIEHLKKLANSKSRDLKTHSIRALRNTTDKEVEELLLGHFVGTKDSHMKNIISGTLKTVGTSKSIPILNEAHKKTRDYGLRYTIEETVKKITERENNPSRDSTN